MYNICLKSNLTLCTPQKLELLPHQVEGVLYGLNKRDRWLLTDEPGLGKTAIAIKLAEELKERGFFEKRTKKLRESGKYEEMSSNLRKLLSKKIKCIETGKIYNSMISASKELGVPQGSISNCCNGKSKSAYGYHFEYVHDDIDWNN